MSSTIRIDHPLIQNSQSEQQDNSKRIRLSLSMVGSYEEMIDWRQIYLNWLESTSLNGTYCVGLVQYSRTWWFHITFDDMRDAVLFKLSWG